MKNIHTYYNIYVNSFYRRNISDIFVKKIKIQILYLKVAALWTNRLYLHGVCMAVISDRVLVYARAIVSPFQWPITNRTCDPAACSAATQPTRPPRVQHNIRHLTGLNVWLCVSDFFNYKTKTNFKNFETWKRNASYNRGNEAKRFMW